MKISSVFFVVALVIASPTSITAAPSIGGDSSESSYLYQPVRDDSNGGYQAVSPSEQASTSNPKPPRMYINPPPGPANEYECIEDELPLTTDVYESPPLATMPTMNEGGASGGSCGPPLEITRTHVVTTTHVVPTTCTVTTTKILPVVTTVVKLKEVVKEVIKFKTIHVDRPVTKIKDVTKTVSFCPTPTSAAFPIDNESGRYMTIVPQPDGYTEAALPEESECIEFEDDPDAPTQKSPPPPKMTSPPAYQTSGALPEESECIEFEDYPDPPVKALPEESECIEFEDYLDAPIKKSSPPPKMTSPPTSHTGVMSPPNETECLEFEDTPQSAEPVQKVGYGTPMFSKYKPSPVASAQKADASTKSGNKTDPSYGNDSSGSYY